MTFSERLAAFGDKTLLEVCQDLHSGIAGSSERSEADLREDANLLSLALKTWQPTIAVRLAAFDDAVRHLIVCALAEHRAFMNKE